MAEINIATLARSILPEFLELVKLRHLFCNTTMLIVGPGEEARQPF